MLVVAVCLALTFIRLPYYTLAPGDVLDVGAAVTVEGEPADIDGDLWLLFVRQRAEINGWRYLQAQFDDDIDLFPEEEFSGGFDPDEVRTMARAEMRLSQLHAQKVALETLGIEVPALDGVTVLAVFTGRPAEGVLEAGDVILAVDGNPTDDIEALGDYMDRVTAGVDVEVRYLRDGEERTATVGTERADDGSTVMGVYVGPRYDFPVDIDIDTGSIGGPSAGLALTLSVLDALSPADLTGGLSVAVTGTIAPDGTVGSVGGVEQKTVTARANGADLFLVPADEVEIAKRRAGDLAVVGVEDVDDALRALDAAGGEPLAPVDLDDLAGDEDRPSAAS